MATEFRPGDLAIGIDFGGSGIKGAVVDVKSGRLVARADDPAYSPNYPG